MGSDVTDRTHFGLWYNMTSGGGNGTSWVRSIQSRVFMANLEDGPGTRIHSSSSVLVLLISLPFVSTSISFRRCHTRFWFNTLKHSVLGLWLLCANTRSARKTSTELFFLFFDFARNTVFFLFFTDSLEAQEEWNDKKGPDDDDDNQGRTKAMLPQLWSRMIVSCRRLLASTFM